MVPRWIGLGLILVGIGCAASAQATGPRPAAAKAVAAIAAAATPSAQPVAAPGAYLLHLPGIAGILRFDHAMVAGLSDGGVGAEVRLYDWTCGDPGVDALRAYARNQEQAQKVADSLTARFRAHPEAPIYLTAHSGGTALLVWALEKLPADVQIQSVLLLAPALSPQYDLSKALAHVRDKAYAFSSVHDVYVLGAGTKLLGTMDGQYTEAAGLDGFVRPDHADANQYRKLVAMPYDQAWFDYGNGGDHIGVMNRLFAGQVLAPLLGGKGLRPSLPAQRTAAGASTQPSPAVIRGL